MENQSRSDLLGQRQERLQNLQAIIKLGINPYPARSKRNALVVDVLQGLKDSTSQAKVVVAGRLLNKREHGKLAFWDLEDTSGKIQIYLKEDSVVKEDGSFSFEELSLIDSGDFIEISGEPTVTQRGEPSVLAHSVRILAKTLRPLPNGELDKEDKFRHRYLDLTLHPEQRALFVRKAAFWQKTRQFLVERGFMEVETPVLEHKTGGADARPFETFHNELQQKFYLRISSELFQKRLIGGGFEKVFTLGPNFRNEGLSDEHLQEYYQVEWYWAYADYQKNMELVKEMFRYIAQEVYKKTEFTTRGHTFDLMKDWQVVDYPAVIKERYDVDIFTSTDEELEAALVKAGITLPGVINRNRVIDNLWKLIRKTMSGPAFLVNEPKFMSPLAKSKEDNLELTERFHVILAGSELGNGYSEINDPQEQLARFLDQEKLRETGDDEAQMLDIDYIEMLEYGMPPTSGYGQSERVFWFLENVTGREGTLFPQLRAQIDNITKKIYGDVLREEAPVLTQTTTTSVIATPASGTPLELVPGKTGEPTLEEAKELLEKNVTDPYQKLHSEMVSYCMEEYADILRAKYPEKTDNFDPELWAITGLIHDWDFTKDPAGHPVNNVQKLTSMGYNKDVTDAILGHAVYLNVPRQTTMAKALFAIDEMTGLMFAYCKMKGSYAGMEVKSVMKKFKDKGFAAKLDRNDIQTGVDELGISLEEHIQNLINILANSKFEPK